VIRVGDPPSGKRHISVPSAYAIVDAFMKTGVESWLRLPTVFGWAMSVMSRTTTLLLPRNVTSARQRLEAVHIAGCVLGVKVGMRRGAEAAFPVGVAATGPQPAARSAVTATTRIQRRALVVIQRKLAAGSIVT